MSGLLLILSLLFALILTIPGLRGPGQPALLVVPLLLSGLAYGLSRTKYYTWTALFTVMVGALAAWAFALMRNPASPSFADDLSFVTVSIVLCGLLLSPRITALLAALHLAGILLAAIFLPALIPFSQLAGLLFLVGSLSALAVAAASIHRRDRRKIDRQGMSLREAGERFYLVSYATSDVVWDWDLSTGQVWRNQGIQRLFGYQADQIGLEMDWWAVRIHPADREKVTEGLRAAIAGVEKFWSKEYRFQRVDGTYADVFDRAYIGLPVSKCIKRQ